MRVGRHPRARTQMKRRRFVLITVIVVLLGLSLLVVRLIDSSNETASTATATTVPDSPQTLPPPTDAEDSVPSAESEPEPSPSTVVEEPTALGGLAGDWATDGASIVDATGQPIRIRGVNWFGFETDAGAPHGLWVRNVYDMIDQIAELGFNTIRLPFSAAMLDDGAMPDGINEFENPELAGATSLEIMDLVIEYAGTRGLAVILDRHALAPGNRHHLWYDDDFPADRIISDWQLLAQRYGEAANVIGADLYNEPHNEACWGCGDPSVDWKLAAEEAGDALHAIDPGWLLFVEGVAQVDGDGCDPEILTDCTWWGGNLSDAMTEPIETIVDDRVVYSPHEYATSVSRLRWFDDPLFPDNMEPIWDHFWGELETSDTAPVMVGEFGTTLDNDIDAVWLEALLAYMDDIGAGWTFWSLNPNSGDTGGILEDDWVSVDEEKLSFLEPYLLGPFEPISD